jgi:hypothetical protein
MVALDQIPLHEIIQVLTPKDDAHYGTHSSSASAHVHGNVKGHNAFTYIESQGILRFVLPLPYHSDTDLLTEKRIECACKTEEDRAAWTEAFRSATHSGAAPEKTYMQQQAGASGRCTGTEILKGVVKKKGHVNPGWKDRFFVLRQDGVRQREREGGRETNP